MRAVISTPLQTYLRQQGRTILTITLKPIRCCGGAIFEVMVDSHAAISPLTTTPRLCRMACASPPLRDLLADQISWMMYGLSLEPGW